MVNNVYRLYSKMFRRFYQRNTYRTVANLSARVEIDAALKEEFDSKQYKPRNHPGTSRIKTASIPEDIQKTINIVLSDNNAKSLLQASKELNNYLNSRLLPPEQSDIDARAKKIYDSVSGKVNENMPKDLTREQIEVTEKRVKDEVYRLLTKNVYRWANIDYDHSTCLQYLMVRAAPEYAVLVRIFDEIKKRCPDYTPRSFFDFGSGVGTGTWAVNTYWRDNIFDYFCVDTSPQMHDLARLLLCKGKENVEIPFRAYFQRQFLPASTVTKYSIVLSAYSLFELPDMKSRLETIQKLWNKTEEFLIIVEQGTRAGFQVVNEAREFVLNLGKSKSKGYVFSPCPNDNVCPRYLEMNTPCNFLMKYRSLPYAVGKSEVYADVFSYVVLRRGVRPQDDPQWPRIVRAPLVRSGHTVCRLCTSQGELKEIIFTKSKHDQTTYRCARSSNWGDELPIKL